VQKDAYTLILDSHRCGGIYQTRRPAGRIANWPNGWACRAPRCARRCSGWKPKAMLTRDGRSLIVASLDHNQLAELYTVRTELEGLAARLAARHATARGNPRAARHGRRG
jgi:hypothetical protein